MMTKKTAINSILSVRVNFLNMLRGDVFLKLFLALSKSNRERGLLNSHMFPFWIRTPNMP
jgi:hypothetical protein